MLPFRVDFEPGVPPYEAVVFGVKKAVAVGVLVPGDALPSVREMSRELKLNPNTCQKAVAALTAEGMIEVRPGIGTVVSVAPVLDVEAALARLDEMIEALVIDAQRSGLSEDLLRKAISRRWEEFQAVRKKAKEATEESP